jgi:very-short-patch-repair endonuclease
MASPHGAAHHGRGDFLVVELDGRPYHASPSAHERDRIRDATLQKVDIRVLRVTDQRFADGPDRVLADVLALRRLAD